MSQGIEGQEEKIINFQLKMLFPKKPFIVDYNAEGRAWVTVVALSDWPISAQGVKGDGTFAWCTLDSPAGPISVGSVYAPNVRA